MLLRVRHPLTHNILKRIPTLVPQLRHFHPCPPRRLFGLHLPEPSNEPLAGTGVDASGPPWVFLLQVVLGLPTALWLYKCIMLVAFQRRIIYLPSVPPGTRDESLADGERTKDRDSSLSGMQWQEVSVTSTVPTRWTRRPVTLKGIELSWKEKEKGQETLPSEQEAGQQHVVIVYLQGNAGTPLMRLPVFRQLLRPSPPSRNLRPPITPHAVPKITVLAVAPRSYWLSTRSTPTEQAVLGDYAAALEYARVEHGPHANYVLYGHSLGGAAAVLLLEKLGHSPFLPLSRLSSWPSSLSSSSASYHPATLPVNAIILENPLPSIPYMVRALYPQKWLPYHYLGPFAFDRWAAMERLSRLSPSSTSEATGSLPPSLWIRSGRDEIIPHGQEDGVRRMYEDWSQVEEGAEEFGKARWVDVEGALHDTAFLEAKWAREIKVFLVEIAKKGKQGCGHARKDSK
ncbi:hypothetical protein JCM11641_008318 [Rhodosporidiobolus odoratus]